MIKLKTYKILSTFLSYPSINLKKNIMSTLILLNEENIIIKDNLLLLKNFINFIKDNNLIYLQEYYVSIFDRKKDFSLYIFEHIHGDSRERGMAMIDLINLYKKSNFTIAETNELPDYIPLFLEYLSLIDKNTSIQLISEIVNILTILEKKLEHINSNYHIIFKILKDMSNIKYNNNLIDTLLFNFKNNNINNNNLDKDWEEPKAF